MPPRFSLFSHYENLHHARLEFADPFSAVNREGLVCRYELHRQTAGVLAPDQAHSGAMGYHLLLPLSQAVELPWNVRFEKLSHQEAAWRLNYDPGLVFGPALAMARAQQYEHLFLVAGGAEERAIFPLAERFGLGVTCFAPQHERANFPGERTEGFYAADAPSFWQRQKPAHHKLADLSPWSNPFRLEAYKLLALEIMAQWQSQIPLVVLHDPWGELTFSFLLASNHRRVFDRAELPFRLVLLQEREFVPLVALFEGRDAVWQPPGDALFHRCWQPPGSIADLITAGLQAHLGTAVALPADLSTETLFARCLTLLQRTMFVDEDEPVIFLSATSPQPG